MAETARILNFPSGPQTANVSPWVITSFPPGASGAISLGAMQGPLTPLQAPISDVDAKEAEMATEGELRAAEVAAAEARTDTKIAKLEGKIDLMISKLDTVSENTIAMRKEVKDSERAVKANGWVIFAALLGALIASMGVLIALAFGLPSMFDLGMKQRDTITKEVQEQVQRQGQEQRQEQELLRRGQELERLRRQPQQQQQLPPNQEQHKQ